MAEQFVAALLLAENFVAAFFERGEQALGVLVAADLTDDLDDGFIDVEVGRHTVMVKEDDVGVLLGHDVRKAFERAGYIGHDG